jgi:hypothetical protein
MLPVVPVVLLPTPVPVSDTLASRVRQLRCRKSLVLAGNIRGFFPRSFQPSPHVVSLSHKTGLVELLFLLASQGWIVIYIPSAVLLLT